MNKKIIWVLAPVAAVALVAAMMPWTLSSHALRRQLANQVRSAVGFVTLVQGHSTFALLPRPRIKLEDVTFNAPDSGLSVHAGIVKGDLSILSLLTGRFELSSISLISTDVSVDLDKPLHIGGAIAQAMKPSSATTTIRSKWLSTVSIVSGTVHITNSASGQKNEIRNINATLDWRHLTSPATLKGSAIWRGTNADVALWINRPTTLLRGGQTPIDLKIDSAAGSLTMDGTLAGRPNLQYDGRIAAYAPLLREAMQLFGINVPLPGPLRDARLTAEGRIDQNSLTLSDTRIALDGNAFEGSLAMQSNRGRAAWSGTLATDLFALSPFLADLPPVVTLDGQWSHDPIDASNLDFGDLDLRISASRAHFGRILLENAGFSILLNNGKLEVTLADAKAYGGTLKGRVNLGHGPDGLDMHMATNFSHVDSAAMLGDILRGTHVSGDANGQIALDGHGENLWSIMHSLAGSGQLTLTGGEISGLDLEQALRRMEKRPLSIATEVRTGETAFRSASAAFNVAAGNVVINQCTAAGPGVDLAMTGATAIGDRSLDLHVVASQTGAMPTGSDPPQLHLDLKGSWDDPLMVLDTASLIRRSAVAAPLLRSLTPSSTAGAKPDDATAADGPAASTAATATSR
jgi:AsmA protein